MGQELIPDEVCRFILTSIPSVPHLEALLLLRGDLVSFWDAETLARRLYTTDKAALQLLDDLKGAGFLVTEANDPSHYRYAPRSDAQADLLDRVAYEYSRNLLEVTRLIHRQAPTRVQQFADAFKIRKE